MFDGGIASSEFLWLDEGGFDNGEFRSDAEAKRTCSSTNFFTGDWFLDAIFIECVVVGTGDGVKVDIILNLGH